MFGLRLVCLKIYPVLKLFWVWRVYSNLIITLKVSHFNHFRNASKLDVFLDCSARISQEYIWHWFLIVWGIPQESQDLFKMNQDPAEKVTPKKHLKQTFEPGYTKDATSRSHFLLALHWYLVECETCTHCLCVGSINWRVATFRF
mgnify:CR=1 FL=1